MHTPTMRNGSATSRDQPDDGRDQQHEQRKGPRDDEQDAPAYGQDENVRERSLTRLPQMRSGAMIRRCDDTPFRSLN
jgi:hypothetical protein